MLMTKRPNSDRGKKLENECPARAAILKSRENGQYLFLDGVQHLSVCKLLHRRKEGAVSLVLRDWHGGFSISSTWHFVKASGFTELTYGKVRYIIESHLRKEPACPSCLALDLSRSGLLERQRTTGSHRTTITSYDSAQVHSEIEMCRDGDLSSVEALFPTNASAVVNTSDAELVIERTCISGEFAGEKAFEGIASQEIEKERSVVTPQGRSVTPEEADNEAKEFCSQPEEAGNEAEDSCSQPERPEARRKRCASASSCCLPELKGESQSESSQFAFRLLHAIVRENAWIKRELDELNAAGCSNE
uniref:Uncharacterized protein n=1 Tax=Trichuris muris TaxID=70415 RepID=A0A5S6QP65_TRIMR